MNRCIGCGITKQTQKQSSPGYAIKPSDEYCLRCFRIKNYNDLIVQDINVDDVINKLMKTLKSERDAVEIYYILDIFDLDGSRILELENLIKTYPVNIVINKIDLLPKSIKLSKVRKYLYEMFTKTCLKDANIIFNSSLKLNFVRSLLNKIKKSNNKAYFIGASNVGKSSIINQLMKINQLIPKIVVSNYYNTTMDFIEIVLDQNHLVIDTPGIFQKNSIATLMHPIDWKFLFFKKEIKQITYQLKTNNSIFFENICWFDFSCENSSIATSFHIFTNSQIKTHRTSLKNAKNYYEKNKIKDILSIVSDDWSSKEYIFDKKDLNKKYEINISGLGWVNFKVNQCFKIKINIPNKSNNVLITLRKPLT